ncbi:MAG: zinc ribbon domain-containing protein [Pyrinomonadaceae bacterium]
MSLGPCPQCREQVSSAATICPFCGNTNFLRKTGNQKKTDCSCLGSNSRCRQCKGLGYYFTNEMRDTRTQTER